MKKVILKCRCCGGTGKRELSEQLTRTLQLVRKMEPIHGAYLAKIDGCQATAMNNRLAVLLDYGLVRVIRAGRKLLYYAR